MPARRDFPVWLCISLLAVAALACNVPGVGQLAVTPTPTEGAGGVVTLEVINQTDSDICVLVASPAGGESAGSNLLADAGHISPGEGWSTAIWPDRYDLLAGDCGDRVLDEERGVDLTAATTYTFAVGGTGETGAGEGSDALAGDSGTVTGRICYPSDFIPAMTAYFEHLGTGQVQTLPIAENQQQYTIHLPPGPYLAYAWLPDGSIGGSYSHAVPCGLSEGCFNHSPLPFTVNAGQTTPDIDICDWYGEPSDVPAPPDR